MVGGSVSAVEGSVSGGTSCEGVKIALSRVNSSTSIKIAPNTNIGDSDVILLDAEIGQLSLRTRYQLKDYWEGWDELVSTATEMRFQGIEIYNVLKDKKDWQQK